MASKPPPSRPPAPPAQPSRPQPGGTVTGGNRTKDGAINYSPPPKAPPRPPTK